MKDLPRLIGALLTTTVLTACVSALNALTPSDGYQASKDIAYGNFDRQKLDVYVPADAKAGRPVVVFFYGGRWSGGSKNDYLFAAQGLVSRGFIAVLADYRVYPEVKFPGFVEDAAQAVAWTRAHIKSYGGDPQKLFIMGHSAGAHIAALLALDKHYLHDVGGSTDWLSGMIGLAGPYDFLPLEDADLQDMFGPPERYPLSQPINFANGSAPPMLLMHGEDDLTVWPRNTMHLAAKIREQGGQVKTIYYKGQGHVTIVSAMATLLNSKVTVLDDAAAFVREHMSAAQNKPHDDDSQISSVYQAQQ